MRKHVSSVRPSTQIKLRTTPAAGGNCAGRSKTACTAGVQAQAVQPVRSAEPSGYSNAFQKHDYHIEHLDETTDELAGGDFSFYDHPLRRILGCRPTLHDICAQPTSRGFRSCVEFSKFIEQKERCSRKLAEDAEAGCRETSEALVRSSPCGTIPRKRQATTRAGRSHAKSPQNKRANASPNESR